MTTRSRPPVQVGQRFGRLVVIGEETRQRYPSSGESYRAVPCRCDCGTETMRRVSPLIRGVVISCGCVLAGFQRGLGSSQASAAGRAVIATLPRPSTHGLTNHPLYSTWRGMRDRCHNPDNRHYKNYGGRGIRVCDEWHDARAFVAWIEANLGPRPARHTLDRIDNDGNYEPGNVRWATQSQQVRNSRPARARQARQASKPA